MNQKHTHTKIADPIGMSHVMMINEYIVTSFRPFDCQVMRLSCIGRITIGTNNNQFNQAVQNNHHENISI